MLERGTPDWGICPGAAARIDADACKSSRCSKCGHKGLDYDPFVDREDKKYVAFAVCPSCGHREEF